MASRIENPAPSPWWSPHIHADRRPLLQARARTFAGWRKWFDDRDFLEVDVNALQVSPGNEAHIAGFATDYVGLDGARQRFYLHSSPEFACKKLLAAGEKRIFSLGHVFRNGERGPLHQPEFTMLEWYRANEPYSGLIDDVSRICALAAQAAGSRTFSHRGRTADPFLEPQRMSVCEAFERFAGIDLAATLGADGINDRDALAHAAQVAGMPMGASDDWSDMFSMILAHKVEPNLGLGRILILDEYPASEAALARRHPHKPQVCERFEAYACGVEIANAFGELTDADEQRIRLESEMAQRRANGQEDYPLDEDFLAALAAMPEASGIALGADRVVMLANGAGSIEATMWTPLAG